jgi:hypothetical protein
MFANFNAAKKEERDDKLIFSEDINRLKKLL